MLTEARLVRQAQSGDATAFLLLYQRYRKGICGFAHRLLGSQAAAEDVTHDCFAIVRTAIGQLPPLQREVLVLCEYEDLPLAEIAAIVDADLETVKARLHRARSNLKRILAPYLNGDRDSQLVEDR